MFFVFALTDLSIGTHNCLLILLNPFYTYILLLIFYLFSVGLEHIDDLIKDFEQALQKLEFL